MQTAETALPRPRREIKLTAKLEARFWAKVNKDGPTMPHMETPCWVWTASTFREGYGSFCVSGKTLGAHCASWMITNGPISAGLGVHHKCDQRLCVRPSHLHLGTTQSNIAERVERGRSACGDRNGARFRPEKLPRGDGHWSRAKPASVPRGEAHNRAKLTTAQVIEIRALYAAGGITLKKLAVQFSMSIPTIFTIIHRKIWKHVG
jgi:hypothetical protein